MNLSKIWNLIDFGWPWTSFWNLLACAADFLWNLKCAIAFQICDILSKSAFKIWNLLRPPKSAPWCSRGSSRFFLHRKILFEEASRSLEIERPSDCSYHFLLNICPPRSQNLKSEIWNLKSAKKSSSKYSALLWNLESASKKNHHSTNLKFFIQESEIWNLKSEIWNLEHG